MKNKYLRKAIVRFKDEIAGILEEIETGFKFTYDKNFMRKNIAISSSLPIQEKPYESNHLFSFFLGLLPEGWYLKIVCKTLKIDENDFFGILVATCKDTIGAISIEEIKENE
ncbi:MAG: HipA N-terminal domain-containing protein [Candidatus Firestonebacteria bacterium]